MRESSIIKYGYDDIVSVSIGTAASVEFEYDDYWPFWCHVIAPQPDRLQFWHVHPSNFPTYSTRDMACMEALNIRFEFPVWFGILIFDDADFNNLDCDQYMYRLKHRQVTEENDWTDYLTDEDLIRLKAISYSRG